MKILRKAIPWKYSDLIKIFDNTLSNFSKNFFYFGVLSCLFLIMHAALLGLDIDSKLFAQLRKIIIVSFIFFELSAQIFQNPKYLN